MPEGRCDLVLLAWLAFVGFNLLTDFSWMATGRSTEASNEASSGTAGGSGAELFRGSYRLRLNGSDVEEGSLRMTLANMQTGISSVSVSSLSMTLRGDNTHVMTPLEPHIVFSGVGFSGLKKLTATGATDPKRLRHFGDRPCRVNTVLETSQESLFGISIGDGSDGKTQVGSIVGEVVGADCGMSMAFVADAIDFAASTQKVVHYSVWANVLTILQMHSLFAQIKHTDDGPSAAHVSIACIGLQALMDSYDAFLHLCLGLSSSYMFNTLAVIALVKFILFSLLEARYLLTIWRHRQPESFTQGWEAVRREVSWLYSRFYGLLVLGLVLLYHNVDHLDLIALAFQAYWVPQILHDAWRGCKTALCPTFCIGMSAARLLSMLYLWGCPSTIFSDDLFPRLPGAPNATLCSWMVVLQAAQLGIMALQQRWGPRWFVPWVCMPWAYNYHRSSQVDPGTDCVICMVEMDPEEARHCVVTPCNHRFHQSCLEQWMEVKMECPTCRTTLPPIQ